MFNTKEIENKWQTYWKEKKLFNAENNSDKEKYYILVEFPYPSGAGLHVGHVRSYTALDAMARLKRMQGYNVLFPMGWDAFGAPAEQYAIKNHIHPALAVKENIKVFKEQLENMGYSFDWEREFSTTDPEYYKWTQWQFLKFYDNGLAYKAEKEINWCPTCKTGLSNEDAAGGVCERCGSKTEKKLKNQWILKMTSYADRLIEGLKDTEFLDKIKTAQINWIGKSRGAIVNFELKGLDEKLEVFTTRPDTLFGVTFMVISPEHKILEKYKDKIKNITEVEKYQNDAKQKTEIERTDATKEKTGVKIEGIEVVHPLNNKQIPIYISDYVLSSYGTGAIMAVPAHDDRDYAFAQKFNLPIIPVIEQITGSPKENEVNDELHITTFNNLLNKKPYTGDGKIINSDFLNGIINKNEAIEKMIIYLEEKGIGHKETNYRLQDWVFSRQRFWGEPIPMIYCEHCGWVPVPYEDLPVILPDVTSYEPTDTGESPLASITEWVNTTCPKCGSHATRETDTMPNWAGSSWYYLRYMDAKNKEEFANFDIMKYWGMVDLYNGGMEHATRHLLYARFWHQFLYDNHLVPTPEPFKKRVAHGMILGENNEKMSKSRGNVVNPDDMVKTYGADALRTFEMFIGDYEKDASWSENGLKGCKRFLDRIYRLSNNLNDKEEYTPELENIINKTIKKVTDDILTMNFNTAVSALMILTNELEKQETISKKDYRILLTLLNPIAPHITEELVDINNLGKPICETKWPTYNEAKLVDSIVTIAVQVNGKLRGSMEVPNGTNNEELIRLAKELENVQKHLIDKEIIKEIVVPNKIVNLVVK